MMGWSKYYDKNLHMIFEEAQTLGMTVSAHTAADSPDLAMSLEKAAVCFPRLNFVAAHPGDKKSFEAHIERLKKYDNFYLDLSGTGIFRYGMLKYGINKAGSEKFLFGTDYPICNAGMYVNAVLYENLNTEDMENVFFKNAKRILGIE
jgi:hypothetical protein